MSLFIRFFGTLHPLYTMKNLQYLSFHNIISSLLEIDFKKNPYFHDIILIPKKMKIYGISETPKFHIVQYADETIIQ